MELKFRDLTADEIDVRVGQITDKKITLLLYKDARCDMQILDETVGPTGWQRRHTRDNANCIVSIYDTDMNCWVEKEDVGVQSNTEAEKGMASDSFKRACVNWGIGRELYTAPRITVWWNNGAGYDRDQKNGKWATYDKFAVADISIRDKKIEKLVIVNENNGAVVFEYPGKQGKDTQKNQTKKAPQAAEQTRQAPPEYQINWTVIYHDKEVDLSKIRDEKLEEFMSLQDISKADYDKALMQFNERQKRR
ncbi:MAG: hypothetical protein Q4C42_11730 [Clostridia bacterium]|nr:hypothetical protein [Clostridia bacterium]